MVISKNTDIMKRISFIKEYESSGFLEVTSRNSIIRSTCEKGSGNRTGDDQQSGSGQREFV